MNTKIRLTVVASAVALLVGCSVTPPDCSGLNNTNAPTCVAPNGTVVPVVTGR